MTNRAAAIYAFEALDTTLDLVPLAGRRALDRAGKKLSLAAWRSLPLEARRAIVDAGTRAEVPVSSVCAALVGATPPPVDIVASPEPDSALPSLVQGALGAERLLDDAAWRALSPLDRFVLASLASRGRAESLALAYDELFRGGDVSRAERGVAGIFVGGASRRMGGTPKGLLLLPSGRTLIDALGETARAAGLEVVLVGRHPAYAALPFPVLDDAPGTPGPLAGLVSLLSYAGARACVALACDAPFVTTPLLQRLFDAPAAIAVAPRGPRGWEPFCARYASADALPVLTRLRAEGHSRLQTILDALPATELPLSESDARALRDWDTPDDIRRDL